MASTKKSDSMTLRESLKAISEKDPLDTLFPNLDALLDWVGKIPLYPKMSHKEKHEYYNVPMSFDIETSSFYRQNGKKKEKVGIMYLWSFSINGGVIQGRTWPEAVRMFDRLAERLDLNEHRHAIVFIRNMEFEFQFLRKWLRWTKVFSVNNRRPVYATTDKGLEFRCSYILSGESLESSGKKLKTYPVRKLVGDLDYSLLRHSDTPLTDKELGYAINDVRVDAAYIQEKMDEVDGLITRIQLTKTGYVRKYCRDACMYKGSHRKHAWKALAFRQRMQRLILDWEEEYPALKRAFQGGFTHTNARHSGITRENVDSWDLTSSYPASMVAYRYPMSSGEFVKVTSEAQFRDLIRLYCCVFDIEFTGLCIREEAPDCPISRSKCWNIRGRCIENNGRIALCDHLMTTITEVDFEVYEKYYTWESMRIGHLWKYKRGYLPTELIDAILTLYEKKTSLKNVPGREQEYNQAKENINACYGMIVTDIARDENVYNGEEWEPPKHPDLQDAITSYNESPRRFLFYPWGVYVTAYSRRRLFWAIWAVGEDYYYSDTDSAKILNGNAHRAYFEEANREITRRIERALKWHRLDPARARPKTITGKEKPLGVWDYEGQYLRFRAIRAKAYMVETEDGISITVSGVNKKAAVPYLCKKYKDPFEHFDSGLRIPEDYTGKLTHTYIDQERTGTVKDYTGREADYHELSAIHLEKAAYDMELAAQYIQYLKGYREAIMPA